MRSCKSFFTPASLGRRGAVNVQPPLQKFFAVCSNPRFPTGEQQAGNRFKRKRKQRQNGRDTGEFGYDMLLYMDSCPHSEYEVSKWYPKSPRGLTTSRRLLISTAFSTRPVRIGSRLVHMSTDSVPSFLYIYLIIKYTPSLHTPV